MGKSAICATALVVVAACSSRDAPKPAAKDERPPPAAAPIDAAPAEPIDAAPALPIDAAPAEPAALAPGKPAFGCFGWSETTRQVACVTGTELHMGGLEVEATLSFLGDKSGPHLPLYRVTGAEKWEWSVSAKTATRAAERLAKDHVVRLVEPATAVLPGKPAEIGGLSITWQQKSDGDEQPPPHRDDEGGGAGAALYEQQLAITCGGKQRTLSDDEHYTGEVSFRTVAGLVVLELAINLGDEGQVGERLTAWVIDPTTCKVAASP